jgi:hypothetical protein
MSIRCDARSHLVRRRKSTTTFHSAPVVWIPNSGKYLWDSQLVSEWAVASLFRLMSDSGMSRPHQLRV